MFYRFNRGASQMILAFNQWQEHVQHGHEFRCHHVINPPAVKAGNSDQVALRGRGPVAGVNLRANATINPCQLNGHCMENIIHPYLDVR